MSRTDPHAQGFVALVLGYGTVGKVVALDQKREAVREHRSLCVVALKRKSSVAVRP